MHVDRLLRLKPTPNDLFYPTIPTFEERVENKNEEVERKREIRNKRRKVDWENECKHIRNRGPMIDRHTWDEVDLNVKSLIYLSLGTEATRIFHRRNPHTLINIVHKRTSVRSRHDLHTSTKSSVGYIPINHSATKRKRKPGDIL